VHTRSGQRVIRCCPFASGSKSPACRTAPGVTLWEDRCAEAEDTGCLPPGWVGCHSLSISDLQPLAARAGEGLPGVWAGDMEGHAGHAAYTNYAVGLQSALLQFATSPPQARLRHLAQHSTAQRRVMPLCCELRHRHRALTAPPHAAAAPAAPAEAALGHRRCCSPKRCG